MAKLYTLDKKLLVGSPEIRIGEKVYPVDDRAKTVRKIIAICGKADGGSEADIDKMDEVLKLALTPKAFNEIDKLELSWTAYQELFNTVLSAAMGEDPQEEEQAEQRFQPAE